MFELPHALPILVSTVLGLSAGGCATKTITAALPTPASIAGEPSRFEGPPADVYGRIASGAMSCWFAVNGQIKKSHIFHADAESPSRGGGVEIAVLERDMVGPKPWGAKAYRVVLAASDDQTTIDIENLKMPEAMAVHMRADVLQWAQGGRDCKLKPIESVPVAETPAAAKKKAKPKVKTAAP